MNSKILWAIVAILVIAIGFQYLYPKESPAVNSQTKEFTLKVKDRKIIEGSNTLTVRQGDVVVISITADEDEELHLHGYDRSVDLEPGVEKTLTFTADASGRFTFELEKSKAELGAIEVLPR